MIAFFKAVFTHFFGSNTFQKGAALAYYAVFSILPIIMIVISLFGVFYGKQAVAGEVFTQLKEVMGTDVSSQIQTLIKDQHVHHSSVWTSMIGLATLALSASGMFTQVHSAFNSMWRLKAKPRNSLQHYLSKHTISILILIALFVVIFASAGVHSFLMRYDQHLPDHFSRFYIYEHLVSFGLLAIIFSLMFRFLGDAKVHWKAALLGGVFTAVLFTLGKTIIGQYIGHSHIATTFGSASAIALLMVWVYYTSQIIFLGASFVDVYSEKIGRPIAPNSDAVKIEHVERSK